MNRYYLLLLVPLVAIVSGCAGPAFVSNDQEGWYKLYHDDLFYCRANPVPNSPLAGPVCVEARWYRKTDPSGYGGPNNVGEINRFPACAPAPTPVPLK